jgi:hypothetical protein
MSGTERLYISHGASGGDWFIVEPRAGHTSRSAANTLITPGDAIGSLLRPGRTVYALDARPFTRDRIVHRLTDSATRHRAEQIIRLLAERDAPLRDAPYTSPDDCALCTGKGTRPAGHDSTCPWRMAREHVRGLDQ